MEVKILADMRLKMRRVLETDLEQMDAFCRSVFFDIGLKNIKIYFNTSHEFWKLIEDENGKIVAIDLANILKNDISMVYGYITLVGKDYRSKGLTKVFTTFWKGHPVMGSASEFYMKRLKTEVWLDKRLSVNGVVNPSDAPIIHLDPTVTLKIAGKSDFDLVSAYDYDIIKLNRSQFLKQWSFSFDDHKSETITILAVQNNRCVGYGTMRLFSTYYGVHPLYADSPSTAMAILAKLVSRLKPHTAFYISAMANRPELMAFCNELGMTVQGTELRHCTLSCMSYVRQLSTSKAYAVHEFWPL